MNRKRLSKKEELVRRYFVLGAGLFIMSFGVAFSIRADLGTSPISSVPYVLSLICSLSVGKLTIMMHCTFVLLQILILRKNYQLIQLLQLAVAFAFGFLTDFALFVTSGISYTSYLQQWILCAIGIGLVGTGVCLEVAAGAVTVAGEGLVLAITKVAPVSFPVMKVIFDVMLVITAVSLSLIFLGTIQGIREGTVAAALLVGTVSKIEKRPANALRRALNIDD